MKRARRRRRTAAEARRAILEAAEKRLIVVGPEAIRLSIGLETLDDLLVDLDYALHASGAVARAAPVAPVEAP